MNPADLILASSAQLGIFVMPLLLAQAGFMNGELAGLAAIVGWFLIGLPASYSIADRAKRRKALRLDRERNRAIPVSTGSAIVPST